MHKSYHICFFLQESYQDTNASQRATRLIITGAYPDVLISRSLFSYLDIVRSVECILIPDALKSVEDICSYPDSSSVEGTTSGSPKIFRRSKPDDASDQLEISTSWRFIFVQK